MTVKKSKLMSVIYDVWWVSKSCRHFWWMSDQVLWSHSSYIFCTSSLLRVHRPYYPGLQLSAFTKWIDFDGWRLDGVHFRFDGNCANDIWLTIPLCIIYFIFIILFTWWAQLYWSAAFWKTSIHIPYLKYKSEIFPTNVFDWMLQKKKFLFSFLVSQ